ncbi:hypothetical protein R1sor_004967 [Riccia sorocarpa]|uniref:Intraflagellar transport protein 74 homolog n=1 Tax=Riccia sorocarpa TaxID=122646 RepID=A0ABD3HMH4_9MARC
MSSSCGYRDMQAAAAAGILMAGTPQRGHTPVPSYNRPASGPSPSRAGFMSSRSERPFRPRTPGSGSVGLDTTVIVENRPVTHHGMISMRIPAQGPGRRILDKSYYHGKLRSKKQEIQAEIDAMEAEIDRLQKRGPTNLHLEHHQESLLEEVNLLRGQLGDYNTVLEKVASGVEPEQLKESLKIIKVKNDKERRKFDQLISERSKKQREIEQFQKHLSGMEAELERRLDKEADKRDKYLEFKWEREQLTEQVEELQTQSEHLDHCIEPLEQDLMKASPAKQKAVFLEEQYLTAERELHRLKSNISPVVQLSPAQAREAILSQIRKDNAEIARAEEKSLLLEAEIKILEDKLLAAENSVSELKGGRADKFLEMQEKEKKMQLFIDEFETVRREKTEAVRLVKEKIDLLLEHVDSTVSSDRTGMDVSQDIEALSQELEERNLELKQLEDMESKTKKEIISCKQKMACLQSEVEKLSRLDDLRATSDSKCIKLEEEKRLEEANNLSLQVQLKEQTMTLESLQKEVNDSPVHTNLEELNQTLFTIQRGIREAQEDIETRERELNYKPVLENIRIIVAQLNAEIKNRVLH